MRILILDHLPPDTEQFHAELPALDPLLRDAGHEVRWLVVTDAEHIPSAPGVRAIVSDRATGEGLPFALPGFAPAPSRQTFQDLTDNQISQYRQVLRKHLDDEVNYFDPHIIHCDGVWLWGQLAVESGVPYVLRALGPELDCRTADPRYGYLVDQAAENAGRIVVTRPEIAARIRKTWEDMDPRLVLLDTSQLQDHDYVAATLVKIYQAVRLERFGTLA